MNLKISQFPIVRMRLIVAILAAVLLLIVASIFASRAFAVGPQETAGQHVITLHDGSEKTGFLTDKHTLREALAAAKIEVGKNDLTEPGLDEQLTAASYEVNIYRARPVNVIDGTTQLKVMTPYRTASQIATQAGIAMRSEDTAVLEKTDDVLSGGAMEQLVIDRAVAVKLVFYGKETTVYTQAKTVGELLKQKDISLGEADKISAADTSPITADMSISIWREGKQTVTSEEVVVRSTRQVKDSDKDIGYEQVQQEGSDGMRNVTYEINVVNGVEVSRTEISSVTTKEPIEKIVVVGTKVSLPAGSHEDWMAAAGIAASDYGYVNYIVGRESGWSPTKSNYAGSGAYGLCQALPASKMATAGGDYMTNPITQLKWCNSYAVGRYGSWAAAYSFWTANHWW